MTTRTVGRLVLVAAVLLGVARTAQGASLKVVDASVLYKQATGMVYFDLEFTREPGLIPPLRPIGSGDSFPALEALPPTDGFQILLDVQPEAEGVGAFPWEVVVRGTEADAAAGIPFRDAEGDPDPDADSGGWGEVIGVSPYELNGNVVKFAAPNSWIGITDPAAVSFELITLEDGMIVDRYVPTPTAALLGLAMLGWMAGHERRRPR